MNFYHAHIKLPEQKLNNNLGVEDIKEMTVVSPLEHRLRDLRAGETYRVCLYNEYYLGMDYERKVFVQLDGGRDKWLKEKKYQSY